MLRLLHTADWHLGQSLHGFERDEEHDRALEALLDLAISEQVDAVILAGDVYHAANPPLSAQRAFFSFLRRLSERAPRTDFIAIAGNHDSGARLELPAALGLGARARLIGAPPRKDGRLDPAAAAIPITGSAAEPQAVLIAFPYPRPGDLAEARGGEGEDAAAPGRPARDFLRRAADAANAQWPGLPLLVTAHLHVAGGAAGAPSERSILIGGEPAIPLSDFPPEAAYVALGHLHRPQTLKGPPLAVYPGPPIPLSLDEAVHEQGAALISLTKEAGGWRASLERRPLQRTRAFLRVPERGAAPIDAVEVALSALAARLAQDQEAPRRPPFLEVVVALETPEPDLRRRIETALAGAPVRLARIRRETPARAETDEDDAAEALAATPPTPEEAFAALHEASFGVEPPQALGAAFETLARGVRNEDAAAAEDAKGLAEGAPHRARRKSGASERR